MRSLIKETLLAMHRNDKESRDIVFIGSRDGEYSCSWQEFLSIGCIKYNKFNEVRPDLVILFDDNSFLKRSKKHGWKFEPAIFPKPNRATLESVRSANVL